MKKHNTNPLARFQGMQSQNATAAIHLRLWQQATLWLSNAFTGGRDDLPVVDGNICIPMDEFNTILASFRGKLEPRTMKALVPCASHEEVDEDCDACRAASDEAPDKAMMVLIVEPVSGNNGIIRPQGPGLVLP